LYLRNYWIPAEQSLRPGEDPSKSSTAKGNLDPETGKAKRLPVPDTTEEGTKEDEQTERSHVGSGLIRLANLLRQGKPENKRFTFISHRPSSDR